MMFGCKKPDFNDLKTALKIDAEHYYNESISLAERSRSYTFTSPKDERKYMDLSIVAIAKSAAIMEVIDKMKEYA